MIWTNRFLPWLIGAAILNCAICQSYDQDLETGGSGDYEYYSEVDDEELSKRQKVTPKATEETILKEDINFRGSSAVGELESTVRNENGDEVFYFEDGSRRKKKKNEQRRQQNSRSNNQRGRGQQPQNNNNNMYGMSAPSQPDLIPPPPPKPKPPVNQPPYLTRKLDKLAVVAGKLLRWRIPSDTFTDKEDGNTRNMSLALRFYNGSLIPPSFWIKLDEKSQEIRALPVDENMIGRWTFKLIVRDKIGQTASDMLELVVRQYSGSRLVNHQFEVEVTFDMRNRYFNFNWDLEVLEKIRRLYADPNYENILVRSTSRSPFVFSWTNSSLTQQSCPKGDIREVYSKMVDDVTDAIGSPSLVMNSLFAPDILPKSIKLTHFGGCLEPNKYSGSPVSGSGGGSGSLFGKSGSSPYEINSNNNVPVIRNPIDRLNVTAGELLRFKVPQDTCYDTEDGPTSRLALQLLTMYRKELSSDSWLQFSPRNQEFLGVPLEEEVGREEYQLVCSDQTGLSAIDGIEVIVLNRPFSERFDVEFAVTFFSNVSRKRVQFVELLASYLGDRGVGNIVLKSVSDNRIVWYNKTLHTLSCAEDADQQGLRELAWIKEMLFEDGDSYEDSSANDDRLITGEAGPGGRIGGGRRVAPELENHLRLLGAVDSVQVILRGGVNNCGGGEGQMVESPRGDNAIDDDERTFFHGIIPSADYLLSFLIPAVIITCMLLLAIILACLLHQRRKAGKLNLFYNETLPPRVPVILENELPQAEEAFLGNSNGPKRFQPGPPPPSHPSGVTSNGTGSGMLSSSGTAQSHEMDGLLHTFDDPMRRGDSLSRPTPAYRRPNV